MFIKENIMLAVAGLKSNKMRALLTMLGIIIGISSVIGIVSVGNALTASVTSNVASMGANNITINVSQKSTDPTEAKKNGQGGGGFPGAGGGRPPSGGKSGSSSTSKTPTDNDLLSIEKINSIKENFSDKINAVSISKNSGSGKVKDGSLYANVSVVGTNDGYKDVKNIKISEGRYISEQDMTDAKKVAVVSDKLVAKMFSDDVNPIGQDVKVYLSGTIKSYTIIGVYAYESNGGNSSASDENLSTDLYLPVTVVKTSSLDKNYQSITIKSNNNVDISGFTDELSAYLSIVYENNKNFEAKASNMQSMLSSLTTMMSTLKIAIAVIAAISLLVGGIGVMNIMLVSVTERTREIGTRKALGAKSSHIQMQFIVESMIICAIGGLIGIALGIIIGAIGAVILKQSPSISIPIILISFTFSMIIGVFFGYYPAKKAARLDPIEALRYE
jgi:putative ABC transport system permease protein